jgi:hypothetical protein
LADRFSEPDGGTGTCTGATARRLDRNNRIGRVMLADLTALGTS